jgi:hypothetical protein
VTRGRPRGAPRPLPRRPYRDSAILHGVLAGLIVAMAALTGGDLRVASAVAVAYWLTATGWGWWSVARRRKAAIAAAAGELAVETPEEPS